MQHLEGALDPGVRRRDRWCHHHEHGRVFGLKPRSLPRTTGRWRFLVLMARYARAGHDQGGMTVPARAADAPVVPSMKRMNAIEEVDISGRCCDRAGRHAAEETAGTGRAGRHDVSARSRRARQLHHWRHISTNAGGNRVIRYGMMRDMVLGLEVVTPDGTVLRAAQYIKNNTASISSICIRHRKQFRRGDARSTSDFRRRLNARRRFRAPLRAGHSLSRTGANIARR